MPFKFQVDDRTIVEGDLVQRTHKQDVVIKGSKNKVCVGQNAHILGSKIEIFGHRNKLIIGKNCRIRGHILIKGNDRTITIGDETTFQGVYLLCSEDSDITIGKYCMLSRKIEVRVTDAHSVIDVENGNRINMPMPVVIGDHVWVGVGCVINKGTVIGDDNIVGAQSFLNKPYNVTQSVIAGSPAKVVKTGVTWHRSAQDNFTKEEMDYWRPSPQDAGDQDLFGLD